jgi:hypothetical protein
MSNRIGVGLLATAMIAAGATAALGDRGAAANAPSAEPRPNVHDAARATEPSTTELPPGHPPVGSRAVSPAAPTAPEAASITWKAPSGWTSVANASSIRIATYRVPRAPGDGVEPELSVSRAGGSTDANVQRWIAQFDDAGKDTREERTIHGLKVTIVEVGGTYVGGAMTPTRGEARQTGYRLLGAVVEAKGGSYFFKLTGPDASVRAARPAFDALLASVAPVD